MGRSSDTQNCLFSAVSSNYPAAIEYRQYPNSEQIAEYDSLTDTPRLSSISLSQRICRAARHLSNPVNRLLEFLADQWPREEFTQAELCEGIGLARSTVQAAVKAARSLACLAVDAPARPGRGRYVLTLDQCPIFGQEAETPVEMQQIQCPILGLDKIPVEKQCPIFGQSTAQSPPNDPEPGPNFGQEMPQCPDFGHWPDEETTTCEPAIKEDGRASNIECRGLTEPLDRRQNTHRPPNNAFEIAAAIESARPQQFPPAELEAVKILLHTHRSSTLRKAFEYPDEKIVAQVLALISSEALTHLLHALRKIPAGDSYGWYLAVIAHRHHGIKPEQLREAREARKPPRKPPQRETNAGFMAGMQTQIRAAAGRRSL